jgi:hypothetical protein
MVTSEQKWINRRRLIVNLDDYSNDILNGDFVDTSED